MIFKTKFPLKISDSPEGFQLRNYYVKNESYAGEIIDGCADHVKGENGNGLLTFEQVYVGIIYSVHVISGTNTLSDTLRSLHTY